MNNITPGCALTSSWWRRHCPNPDAFEICQEKKFSPAPFEHVLVIIISDRDEEYLEAAAFNAGQVIIKSSRCFPAACD